METFVDIFQKLLSSIAEHCLPAQGIYAGRCRIRDFESLARPFVQMKNNWRHIGGNSGFYCEAGIIVA